MIVTLPTSSGGGQSHDLFATVCCIHATPPEWVESEITPSAQAR